MRYFYGPDTYGARQAIGEVARQETAAIRWTDREHVEQKSIGDIVSASRGLFGRDCVVVRDPSEWPKALQESVAAYAEGEGKDRFWVLWDRGAPDKRSKFWQAVKEAAREFGPLTARELERWLMDQARAEGRELTAPAAAMLVSRLGGDRWRLLNELRRLLVIAPQVSAALVEREVAVAATAEIFAMLDALVKGRRAEAVRSVEALLFMGQSEFYILSMLGYQFRTLLMIRTGLDEGKTAAVIAREGKLHSYVVDKNKPVAERTRGSAWREGLTRILATDFAIKQGKVDARTGLLMLVVTLSRLFSE